MRTFYKALSIFTLCTVLTNLHGQNFLTEDFSTFNAAQYYTAGNAYYDATNQYFILTPPTNENRGRIFYKTLFPIAQFVANFDIKIGGGSGGDGVVFAFVEDYTYPAGIGGRLDFGGASGYGVEFDTWDNGEFGDPSEEHIAIVHNSANNHLSFYIAPNGEIEDNQWHQVFVQFSLGQIKVYLDGALKLDYLVPNFQIFNGYFGFTAATGVANNWQIIDNIMVSSQGGVVILSCPNGGEFWEVGNSYNITWNSINISQVNLEFSIDGGSTWMPIASNIPAESGSYTWIIPNTPSQNCLVRISDASNPSTFDISNNVFTITLDALNEGLVAYYPFNGNANDESPNNNDGTVFGAVLTEDRLGNPNSAYLFDGIDDYIDIGNHSSLKPVLPVTFTAWVKNNQIGATVSNPYFTNDFHTTRYYGVWFNTNPTGQVMSNYGDGDDIIDPASRRSKISNTILSEGIWYHVAGVIRGPLDMDIYINGVNDGGIYEGSGSALNYSNGSGSIGRKDFSTFDPTTYFNGVIDEICFYNRALSETEIQNIYSGGLNNSIILTAPNGGETWQVGTVPSITWFSTGIPNVKIEYSTNGGATWELPIVDSYPAGNQSFSWTIPNTPSLYCLVKISDANDPSVFDISNQAFKIISSIIPLEGLIAYYPFNGNANDESLDNNDGTVFGAVLTEDRLGNPNSAYLFDGINDYIDIGNHSSLKPVLPVTFTAWVKNNQIGPAVNNPYFTNDFHTTRYYGVWFYTNATGQVVINYGDGGDIDPASRRSKISNTILSEGIWYHVAGVIRGPLDMDIYINGVNDGGTYEGSGSTLTYSNGSGNIGRKDFSSFNPSTYFNGAIDEICFYNRALSEPEIQDIYSGGFNSSIILTAPNGGETWQVGTQQNITWTSTGVANVKIEYSTDGGTTWEPPIVTSYPAGNQSYAWTVPNTPTNNGLVKIGDAANLILNDVSDNVFSIQSELQNGSIGGVISGAEFKSGIANAQLELESTGNPTISVYSNANGTYLIENIPPETYTLTISHSDYVTKVLGPIIINPNTHITDLDVELGKLVEDGDVLLNTTNLYYFRISEQPTSQYTFIFEFDERSTTKTPQNWSEYPLFKIPTTSNQIVLTETQWESFCSGKYTWYVVFDNGIILGKDFIKALIEVPMTIDPLQEPVLLVHGWTGDMTTFYDFRDRFNDGNPNYDAWLVEYPNTGDILWCASVIPKAISYIKNRLHLGSTDKINVITHSMGGLVTRAYSVSLAKKVSGQSIVYQNDIDKFIMSAPPNQGGRFAEIAKIFKYKGDQYSIGQLKINGLFLTQMLTPDQVEPVINHLIIAGNNPDLLSYLTISSGDPFQQITPTTLASWTAATILGENDVPVYKRHTIVNSGTRYYKVIFRHHANIHKPENVSDPVFQWVLDFLDDGFIESDPYIYEDFLTAKIYGKVQSFLPFLSGENSTTDIAGCIITLRNLQTQQLSYHLSDSEGNFYADYIPIGDHRLTYTAKGFVSDSLEITVSDSNQVLNQNFALRQDPLYIGPIDPSIELNNGSVVTTDTLANCNLSCQNAVEVILSEDALFDSSTWQPFSSTTTFVLSGEKELKTVFAKFRDVNGNESDIVFDQILYDSVGVGMINIQANFNDCLVLLNNEVVGTTLPLTISNIPEGQHKVSVLKSGFVADSTNRIVNVNAGQISQAYFNFADINPQPPRNFTGIVNQDTIQLTWQNPSDLDLHSVRILYRLDGIFPTSPTDGTVVYENPAQPDSLDQFEFLAILQDTTYYLAVFSKDVGGNYSTGAHSSVFVQQICTPGLLGDITGDGATNSTDGLVLLSYDAGFPLPQPFLDRIAIGFGDVNEDNLTNSTDALITLSWEAGFPVPFPVGQQVCLPDNSRTTTLPTKNASLPAGLSGLNHQGLTASKMSLNKGSATIRASAAPAYTQLLTGQTIEIPVVVDMGAIQEQLGSYTITMEWNSAVLQFESYRGGSAVGFDNPVVNTAETTNGKLIAAHAYPQGAAGVVTILNLQFKVAGTPGADPGLSLKFSALAAARTFTDLLPYLELSENVLSVEELPTEYAIANYPNPFNASTEIHYQLPEAVKVEIVLFNVLGQKIRVLVNRRQEGGKYRLTWNGDSEQGQLLPSGIYFLRMMAGRFVADRKLLLLK